MYLRQNTAQVVRFGPCLDKTDGVTEETALTLAQADMRLSKDGGTFAQKSAAGNAVHDSDGWYNTTFSTTDTDTVGEVRLNVHQPANMLPVWDRWWVMEEAVYDLFYGPGATGRVTLAALTHTGAVIPTVTTLTGHTKQTADHTAAIAALPTVTEFNARTLTSASYALEATHTSMKGATFAEGTDSLEAIRDRGDAAWTTGAGGSNPFVLQNTTIATLASQTSFTLTAGSPDDAAYRNMLIVIEASATPTQKAVGVISAYAGGTLTVTLREDPGVFSMAVGDTVDVLAISPDSADLVAKISSYPEGAIIIDTVNGESGTVFQVNGTPQNPVDNVADARTLADLGSLTRYVLRGASIVTLGAAHTGWTFLLSRAAELQLGGQDVDNSSVAGGKVSGIGLAATNGIQMERVDLFGVTSQGFFFDCSLPQVDAMTLNGPLGQFIDCVSTFPGAVNPSINAGGIASAGLSVTKYAGGIDIGNVGANSNITVSGRGSLEFTDASVSSVVVNVSGHMRLLGSVPTGMTLTDSARIDKQQIADTTWDELEAGHTTAGTFGKFLDVEVSSVSGGGGLTQQQVADAMRLTPVGTVNTDSIDEKLDTLLARITTTLFAGMTSLGEWLGLLAGKQVGDATARTELQATGAGSGTYDETTDALEALRDDMADIIWDELKAGHTTAATFGKFLDVEVSSVSGGGGLTQQQVADAMRLTPAGTVNTDSIDDKLDTLLSRVTSTLFAGMTSLAQWLGLLAGEQAGDATARTEIRATGAGSGTYDETTDASEAIRDAITAVKGDTDGILTDTADMQPKLGNPATDVSADIAAVKAETALIVADTDAILIDTADMQPKLGAPVADVSADIAAVKAETALIVADTGELKTDDIPGLIAALNDISAAEVNAEMLDVMNVDTYAEPGQLAPPATASLAVKISHIYKRWRNKSDNAGPTTRYYADNGTTVDQKQTTSESGGTVTVGELESGP